jgi:hypothetical protein
MHSACPLVLDVQPSVRTSIVSEGLGGRRGNGREFISQPNAYWIRTVINHGTAMEAADAPVCTWL